MRRRFWAKVDKDGPIPEYRPDLGRCWIWTAAKYQKGYGKFRVGSRTDNTRRSVGAHRFAYELLVGPIPDGLQLDHLCRVPACVNPDHLEPVTHAENLRRGESATRNKTHCPADHPYDEANTYVWQGTRACRMCIAERSRAYRRRRKLKSVG